MMLRSLCCLPAIFASLARASAVSKATYYELSPENEITCIGHLPQPWKDWDDSLNLPFPYHGLPPHVATLFEYGDGLYRLDGKPDTLAEFCAHSTGVTCVQTDILAPRHLEFPLLLQLEAESGQGEVRNVPYSNHNQVSTAYLDSTDYRHVQMAAEFCQAKCACSIHESTAPQPEMKNYYAPSLSPRRLADGRVLVWNFDQHHATVRRRNPQETTWWKNGIVLSIFSARVEHEVNQILAQYYVGALENKPVCDDSTFSYTLESLLNTYTDVDYTTAAELCAHRFYGGNNYTSMGGICLQPKGISSRQLAFPYELKAPEFTREFPRPNDLQSLAFPIAVEAFCRSHCMCDDESDKSNKTRPQINPVSALESWALLVQNGQCADKPGRPGSCPSPETVAPKDSADSNNRQAAENQTCPAQCTYATPSSKPTCGDGCECRAFQSIDPVFPASPESAKFLSWCVSSTIAAIVKAGYGSSKKGKSIPRSSVQAAACPCNLTYVSEACCQAGSDGIVWENGNAKLGEILVP